MDEESVKEKPPKKEKAPRAKKRPSDFEIIRTILQRTHMRRIPFLFRHMGEPSDCLFFCSQKEEHMTYGSPDITIAMIQFHDPELQTICDTFLAKLHGICDDKGHPIIINVRDQISEWAKTKGESNDCVVKTDDHGSVWTKKDNVNGETKSVFFAEIVESLFHVQIVQDWAKRYHPLLTTTDPQHLYYPTEMSDHPDMTQTVILSPDEMVDHPIWSLYPHGFRARMTKGVDLISVKAAQDSPYPVLSSEIVITKESGGACQLTHRVKGLGWTMILTRPNALFFPALTTPLPSYTGHHL
jgi:hypothetical protein